GCNYVYEQLPFLSYMTLDYLIPCTMQGIVTGCLFDILVGRVRWRRRRGKPKDMMEEEYVGIEEVGA
ncbi:hypothetical protein SK128_013865, partial [Halocaridina rubra]